MRLIYLLTVGVLSVVLAGIAVFGEGFIRSHGSDIVVVAWLYLLIRLVTMMPRGLALILTLTVAFGVEIGQMFDVAGQLGLGEGRGARLALGSTFDPFDFLAYAAGGLLTYFADGTLTKDHK